MNKLPKLAMVLLFALFSIGLQAQQLTPFSKDGKFGYLDKTGKVAINPIYDNAYPFSTDGYARVEIRDGIFGFIDTEGRLISIEGTSVNTKSPSIKGEAEATAALFCECGAPMLEMKKRMDAASDEEKMAIAGEAMKAAGEMMECMGGEEALKKLEEGKTEAQKKKFEDDMKAEMYIICPELAREMDM
jgi:hypothetical protein